jgi:hypothetical protein
LPASPAALAAEANVKQIYEKDKEALSTSYTPKIEAHIYCALMLEAVIAAVSSYDLHQHAKDEKNADIKEDYERSSGIHARYAFQTACIATEAGANTLLEATANMSKSLYSDMEKLKTLNKYEVYALVNGTPLDRGSKIYEMMKSVISRRNNFIHPKRVQVPVWDVVNMNVEIAKGAAVCEVPALDFLGPHNAIPMVAAILRFLSWVVCDMCGHTVQEGADRLSRRYRVNDDSLFIANEDLGYDIRSFGVTDRRDSERGTA